MIRAAFFDIDGTLLTKKGKVLPSTLKAIEKLHQEGVLCCIASGRGPKNLPKVIRKLPMDAYVLYNGQIVFSHDAGIYEHTFEQDTLKALATLGDNENRKMIFGGRNKFYGSKFMKLGHKKWLNRLQHMLSNHLTFTEIESLVKKTNFFPQKDNKLQDLPIFDKRIYQCMMLCSVTEENRLKQLLPNCTFTRSNPYFVDVIPKGGSKMVGIRKTLEHYNIKPEESIAFGDSWNDSQMLSEIGIGVAMGNATSEIKTLADYTTNTNEQDGIYKALIHFDVIK